jgi:septal ring factor EnvC (AmiA/AmiB activator)
MITVLAIAAVLLLALVILLVRACGQLELTRRRQAEDLAAVRQAREDLRKTVTAAEWRRDTYRAVCEAQEKRIEVLEEELAGVQLELQGAGRHIEILAAQVDDARYDAELAKMDDSPVLRVVKVDVGDLG